MDRIRLGTALLVAGVTAMLLPSAAGAATFSNTAPITINDPTADCDVPGQGPANPYPSPIQASEQTGSITDTSVTITGYSHTNPADTSILLVGPHGQTADLMDEAGGGTDVSD